MPIIYSNRVAALHSQIRAKICIKMSSTATALRESFQITSNFISSVYQKICGATHTIKDIKKSIRKPFSSTTLPRSTCFTFSTHAFRFFFQLPICYVSFRLDRINFLPETVFAYTLSRNTTEEDVPISTRIYSGIIMKSSTQK